MGGSGMNEKRQERIESAILYVVRQFPGLMGPMAIQAAVKAVFQVPEEESARIEDNLAFLESMGLLIRRDSGRGYPVFFLSDRANQLMPSDGPRIQFRPPAYA